MVQRESEVGGARRIERKAAVTIFTAAFHTWGHDLQHAHTCLHMPSLTTPPQHWDTPSPGEAMTRWWCVVDNNVTTQTMCVHNPPHVTMQYAVVTTNDMSRRQRNASTRVH